jgi:hypothetical protein
MHCDEYRKIDLHHQYAIKRVRRFARPDEEPRLVDPKGRQLTTSELAIRLGKARADETETRLAMQNHLKTCDVCDHGGLNDWVHPPL